jgi:thiol-disulfide isomerase/thioredoxin
MKKIIVMMGMLLPALLFAQEKFVIKGKIGQVSAPAKVFLNYQQLPDYAWIDDSAVLNNGAFEFKGTANYPVEATLTLRRNGKVAYGKDESCSIFIENGVVTVKGDSLPNATVKGGKENNSHQQVTAMLKPVKDRRWQLYHEHISIEEYRAKMAQLNEEEKAVYAQFVRTHTNSFVSFRLLRYNYGKKPPVEEVGPLFHLLSDRIKNSEPGKIYGNIIAHWEKVRPGSVAPDFTSLDTLNKPVSLSDFKGKYVLLNFWSTSCGPCMSEKRDLKQTYAAFKGDKFELFDISMSHKNNKEKDWKRWRTIVRNYGLPWINVYGDEAIEAYGIEATPENILVGPDGRIVAYDVHGEDLNKKLEELLGKKISIDHTATPASGVLHKQLN